MEHYKHVWEHQDVWWLQCHRKVRGHGRARDMRPLVAGGGRKNRPYGVPAPHAWCSDSEDEEDEAAAEGPARAAAEGEGGDGVGADGGEGEATGPTAPA